MKKLIVKLGFYFFGLISTLIVLFFMTGYLSCNHRLGTTKTKNQRLSKLESPKIILVGGSNLHYGMNSELLENEFNLPVVNMGLQGGIGLRYMFAEIINEVDENDIVILLTESGHFCNYVDIDGEKTLYTLVSKYPRGLQYLTSKQFLNSFYSVGAVIKENIEYIVTLTALKLFNKSTIFENTNKWGDYVGHRNKTSILQSTTLNGEATIERSKKTMKLVKEVKTQIESQKAHFLIGFTPLAKSYANRKHLEIIDQEIINSFGKSKIGNIHDYIFPDSFFYDTPHHLLFSKRELRTEQLIKDIKKNRLGVLQKLNATQN